MQLDDLHLAVPDVLQLYRVFPRLVDADAQQSFALFESILRQRTSLGEPTHEIMHRIQAIKLSHQRVTRTMFETWSAVEKP